MTDLESHVAWHIREALHKFDVTKHGNYALYVARVAIKAMAAAGEPVAEPPQTPPPAVPAVESLDDLF